MERHGNYGESNPSLGTFNKGTGDLMTYIQSMLETQQKQLEILYQGLLGLAIQSRNYLEVQKVTTESVKQLDAEQ